MTVCRFCGEEPDGDRVSFADAKATRCNKPRCVLAWEQETRRLWWRDCANRREMGRSLHERRRGRKDKRRVKGIAA